ncbi:hypothetical protein FH972_025573 [Carpinus fangiana]|uniref:Uncharacterized protein n=1 Tax=Carpinus fangiana TaxID=176857 RepID=A0A5N6L1I5_9ROSI|nr:hypothetical protein FH972_025573 [Carpinus fangiana]
MKVIEVVGSLKELAAVAGTQGGGVEGGIDEVEGGVVRADELEKLKQMAVVLRKEVGEVAAGSIFEFFGEEFCVLPEE